MDVFIKGNSKVGPEVMIFNLPPIRTCTPTKWCRENCYALMGRHRWQNVKDSWQKRLEISKGPNFVNLAVAELKKRKPRYVRPHLAGDFYDAEYVRKWIEIVKQCPEILFRTTTKRKDLGKTLQKLNSLPNMTVRESLDISHPKPSGLLPLVTVIEGTPTKQKLLPCTDDCVACDYTCWKKRISLIVKMQPKC